MTEDAANLDEVLTLSDDLGRILGELLAETESARESEMPLNADALEAVEKGAWAIGALAELVRAGTVDRAAAEKAYEHAKTVNPTPASLYTQRAYNAPMLDLEGEAQAIYESWRALNARLRRPTPEPRP